MAKRASILSDNYNPVGERLRRVTQPMLLEEKSLSLPRPREEEARESQPSSVPGLRERELIPEIPIDKELKTVSVRFRCTLNERKKWHTITRELSGDHNNLSHFIRAAMLLLEHSDEQLLRMAPDFQRFRKPATTDTLGIVIYEQRLAQLLYDAIRNAGRPKP